MTSCMLDGICDYLGHRKQVDLESRQDSAPIVLAPKSLGNCQSVWSICCGTPLITSRQQRATSGQFLIKHQPTQLSKRRTWARGKELVRLCNVAGSTFRQGHSETALVSFALCREVDRPTNSKGGCILRRRKLASQRNEFFDTER